MARHTVRLAGLTLAALALTGCPRLDASDPEPEPRQPAPSPAPTTEPEPPPGDGEASPTETETAEPLGPVELLVTEVATDLEVPWDVIAHDGRVLVTERDTGRLLEIDPGSVGAGGDHDGAATEVRSFDVDPAGEGGLLGLASDGEALFVYYTADDGNRVVRLDEVDGGQEQPLVTGIPKGRVHNGGRMAIGPDGHLYVGTGDAGNGGLAPDRDSLAGKVLRIDRDGAVPDDNPFDGSPVWSLGHRNVQGLSFDGGGRLWAAELGPDVDDEINLIEAGQDYGWPEVTGAPGVDGAVDAKFVAQPPEASWSGAAVLIDAAIPQWQGDLLVTGLRGERLWRLVLDGAQVAEAEQHHAGEFGRLRTTRIAPDGALWLLTSNRDGRGSPSDGDDRLLRIGP